MKSLHDYQVDDLAYYMTTPRCLNISDPGTGKTPSVCVWQYQLYDAERVKSIWTMPKSLLPKNKRELHTFTPFEDDEVVIVDGTKNQVRAQLESERAKVFLMGGSRFRLVQNELPEDVKATQVDELHMLFSTHESQRTKALYKFMRKAPYFLGMTGTLIAGRLSSAYPSISVIDPRYYGSYQNFLAHHAVLDYWGKVERWVSHEKIQAILDHYAIQRTFESVHGPEAKVVIPEEVPMANKQRAIYDEFAEAALLELDRFFIDGSLPGVNFIRSRQIMEHPNQFPDLTAKGQFVDILDGQPTAKEERILIHLEEHKATGKPLVLFSCMVPQHHRLKKLCDDVGISSAIMNGQVTGKARDEVDRGFQSGKYQVLICSQQVAAFGFNWQEAGGQEVEHVIMVSIDPSDHSFVQAYRRFIRGVRKSILRITALFYEDSMDQHIADLIKIRSIDANKVDSSKEVFEFT